MSTPTDLQALLASIRPRPSPSNTPGQDNHQAQRQSYYQPALFPPHPQQQQPYDGQSYPHPQSHGYQHPSVSSTSQSPAPMNAPPHQSSDILSPNMPSPRGEWPQQPQPQHTNSGSVDLLNLLRFSQRPGASAQPQVPAAAPDHLQPPPAQGAPSSHGRNISASDLVATLFGQQAPAAPAAAPAGPPPAFQSGQPEGPNENTQDMLLRLLNRSRPGPAVAESPALASTQQVPYMQAAVDEHQNQTAKNVFMEVVDESPRAPANPETVVSPNSKDSMFTYVNPFDQLAAISPVNKSPQSASGIQSPAVEVTQKQKINVSTKLEPSQTPELAAPREGTQSPILNEDQREAVHEVVGRFVDEISRSLSGDEPRAATEVKTAVPTAQEKSSEAFLSSIASQLRETTAEAKEAASLTQVDELVKETESPTVPVALKVTESTEALADSWESAEDSAEKEEERVVSVYNFPMRPFISIAVKATSGKLTTFRDDDVMDIARLKKEFDQLDRSLTAATSEYIVYALAKTGGIRIIRQDDGSDRQVFRSTRDRVFNVALCTAPTAAGDSEVQAILGIGVSGSVYWALISRSGKDFFDMDALESESLIFPPFPASDENTSGGQLKTRAKRSTRHTNLFAIGRGKNIYVVSPKAAMSPAYGVSGTQRTVNTEKFFKERALKISTGKAGKDFAFSDDDSVIASLDKTGRLRFWDINDMLNDASFVEGPAPAEIRVPLTTFVTGSPTEKSWPTSVLFLDKLRAYSRSMALRYVLVGLKQNHTLQLWDIGLGKAVQELKFPHENESDAICSVAYHPSSGVIVVGHPTRNSIYFAHLSAPRYNLPQMSQAAYIRDLNDKDNTLPKPESTACLSGIREISLGSKGQLRSLELLPITKSATDKRGTEETPLFELYVMHSRGVTCLNIKKEDLGWTADNKVIRPIDALEQGVIEISDLQTFPTYATDDPSLNGDTASIQSRVGPKESAKKPEIGELASGVAPSRNASPIKLAKKKEEISEAPAVVEKSEKKKKKKASAAAEAAKAKEPSLTAGVEPLPVPAAAAKELQTLASSTTAMGATQAAEHAVPGFGLSSEAFSKHIQTLQGSVSSEFNKSLGHEFENLHRRFDDERRSWDAASSAKQDQVLRLVSSTLSDNVEKNLARIVSASIQTDVIPVIADATSAAVNKQLNGAVSQQLGGAFNEELRQVLPKAVINAMQQAPVVKAVSDSVAQKLAPRIEAEVTRVMQSSIAPMIESLARITKKVESDMERHFQEQINYYEAQRQSDTAKIEEMSALLRGLSNTVSLLAANQGHQLQQTQSPQHEIPHREILNANKHSTRQPSENQVRMPQPLSQPVLQPQAIPVQAPVPVPVASPVARSPEEIEMGDIVQLINTAHYEQGTIKWLQSNQQADLFDNFFVHISPAYLSRLSAIVMLSVAVAVTTTMQTNIGQRLHWLEVVLQNVNPRDTDLREVAPRILDIMSQRLNTLYMSVVERNPHDPILRLISPLARRARELHASLS
ncbi:hypothetical protein DTO027I6_7656 [Penicillium roqueforti]|uniref:uncharacterized protein n=1 Tax=Penicillium roqueforti TaxID=5082 RepID=UPI001909B12E|nr:uncharacterized protein LCP9604111_9422 [Penicillium roqueforti]KAF9238606.1 hypothetical protein LCP9604111_9422 [Penicillium roqueforti]KAI2704855.1 hypothetical protein CBS147372_1158 [Penicillium roqueforti]KAI2718209.1 hypothetical protein CBS147318_4786 [Penicillium roqueforti]KAI3110358.1 hypothetical protein CBS147333_4901 [Penicillium roqueforti]KAI3130893.1 hypothetical protein CBS147330_4594 [Penicillium roqueforti]